MKINLRESLNKIDLATNNKYDLLNTFDSKKLSDNSKKKLAEAIENNSIASINRVLHESKEQLYKVVIQSGATKRDFESALYEDEAEGIIDYYGGRWIDENGFEWDMYIEEDDDSTEHAAVDNSYDMDEFLTEAIKDVNSLHSKIWNMDNNEKICFPNGYCVKCEFYDREGKAKRYIVTDKEDNVIIKGKFGFAWQPQIKKFEEDFFNLLNGRSVDESLTEANYGGAYDIEDDMFFTKEEIVEFAEEICEYLGDIFGYQYDINNVYMDGPRKLYINIYDNNYIEVESTFDIDMRKIRKPSDLFKVYGLTIKNWFQKAFAREYRDAGLDESLTEDTVKQNGKWVNKGSEGTHGKFKTKKAADAQRKAMFANGYKAESLNEQKYSSGNYFLTVDETGMGPHYSLYYQHPHSDYDGLMFIVDGYGYDNFKEKLSKFSTVYPNKDVQNLLKNIKKHVPGKEESLEEQINLPGYAVKYTAGYSGNGVNDGKTEWFRTKEERDKRAKELKDKNYTEIKTWKMDNFYHTPPKSESLKEAFDDEIDLDYETDFDDDNVEEGNVFVEGGVEYTWIQREAGPLYLDFDKWAVWSAREYVDPREFMTIHDDGKGYDFDGDAFKEKAMAAPIVYFVVEEDTGFIDWGPVESRIEAQDFLNGKQEDWDNNEYYGESLEKNLDEWYVNTIHYEDIGDGREYDYEVDHEEVLDYLSEIAIDEEDAPEDTEEYLKWVEDNFDELFNKYEYEIEEHFREDASQEEYDRRHSSYKS